MKVLKVCPNRHPVVVDIDFELETLQKEVGGYIQVIRPFSDPVAIVCDDDGKLKEKLACRCLRNRNNMIYDTLCGDFLIVGVRNEEFVELAPDLINKYMDYFWSIEHYAIIGGALLCFNEDDDVIGYQA